MFHTSELEVKEDKVGMFNGYPVVINEVSMALLVLCHALRAVEDNVMKNIAPDDEKAANVRHNDVENYAMNGFALKNAKKNDELKSKIANEEYENQIYSCPKLS